MFVPFPATQFTNDVDRVLLGYVIAATLLIGSGLLKDMVLKKIKTQVPNDLFGAILLGISTIRAELAVDNVGTPIARK